MKTPWSKLLDYGTGLATLLVVLVAGLIMFVLIGVFVIAAKIGMYIK